jgi:hypothetical protein
VWPVSKSSTAERQWEEDETWSSVFIQGGA